MADDSQVRDVVVVGASAGGVEALVRFVRKLPHDLAAAVFVVLHVPPSGTSVLPQILSREGRLPAHHPTNGDEVRRGQIYIAPPDHHMTLSDGIVAVDRGPRENGVRPAVDALFRSAAEEKGARVIGVVLSGTLNDGTAGLAAIKRCGGVTMVQDPTDALYPAMPRSALDHVAPDFVLAPQDIAEVVAKLVEGNGRTPSVVADEVVALPDRKQTDPLRNPEKPLGHAVGYSCPDCNGALWELSDGDLVRYECRIGHAFSQDAFDARQAEQLDIALWTAVRSLEERASLANRIAERLQHQGYDRGASRFRTQAADASDRAALVRSVLERGADEPERPTGTAD